ncbi:polymorphic toxin-type HINT domain-containing protein [Streptomyces sp. NBC_01707]|uniref:polymorphic toxin-type HINT domain-containing protein n=1 Tax=Streptomyces sp. NBC_01707 TaxID=2975914 RepID=UPI00352C7BE2
MWQIKPGDRVESAEPGNGKHQGPRTVTAQLVHHDRDLVNVTIRRNNGHTAVLHTTSRHPFWDATLHAWVQAGDLTSGHALTTATDRHIRIVSVQALTGAADMYNLTVADLHTYYVLAGTTPVLVHNTCGPTNSAQAGLPIHAQPTRFYARAGEMLERVAGNPTTHEQMYGSVDAGHGGVSALSNEDLIRFGGPKTCPVSDDQDRWGKVQWQDDSLDHPERPSSCPRLPTTSHWRMPRETALCCSVSRNVRTPSSGKPWPPIPTPRP